MEFPLLKGFLSRVFYSCQAPTLPAHGSPLLQSPLAPESCARRPSQAAGLLSLPTALPLRCPLPPLGGGHQGFLELPVALGTHRAWLLGTFLAAP